MGCSSYRWACLIHVVCEEKMATEKKLEVLQDKFLPLTTDVSHESNRQSVGYEMEASNKKNSK